ncbi:MAG: hypothetical protein AAGA60_01515 [Cyanobacteria bacterium P01_E01_bin.42]
MDWKPVSEVREWHCAANEEDYFKMEERFRQQGLDIRLVDIVETDDPILRVTCIFDGADADRQAERFKPYQEKE